jgi:hypothetical protein
MCVHIAAALEYKVTGGWQRHAGAAEQEVVLVKVAVSAQTDKHKPILETEWQAPGNMSAYHVSRNNMMQLLAGYIKTLTWNLMPYTQQQSALPHCAPPVAGPVNPQSQSVYLHYPLPLYMPGHREYHR